MESTAFNQAGWNPLHLIGMHFTTLHGIHCIQLGSIAQRCMESTAFHECGPMDLDWMQWIPCSVFECSLCHAAWRNETLLNAVDFMQHDWMQWIPCSMIECSGCYAAWPNASRLNAVDSMHCDWIQFTPCTLVKCIPIECSVLHALC